VLIGEVASGEQAISAARDRVPDVLVLDMEVPGVHAIIVARMILNLQPHLGIMAWIDLDESEELPDQKAYYMQHMGVCCCVDDESDQAEIGQARPSCRQPEVMNS
jgi:DNA-binding NarL/FixJ family response regulator